MFVGNGVAGLAEHLARIDNDLDKPQPLPRKIVWLGKTARWRNDLYSSAEQWPVECRSNDGNVLLQMRVHVFQTSFAGVLTSRIS